MIEKYISSHHQIDIWIDSQYLSNSSKITTNTDTATLSSPKSMSESVLPNWIGIQRSRMHCTLACTRKCLSESLFVVSIDKYTNTQNTQLRHLFVNSGILSVDVQWQSGSTLLEVQHNGKQKALHNDKCSGYNDMNETNGSIKGGGECVSKSTLRRKIFIWQRTMYFDKFKYAFTSRLSPEIYGRGEKLPLGTVLNRRCIESKGCRKLLSLILFGICHIYK